MIEVATKFKKYLFVHLNRRWDNDFLLIKSYIDSQILGNILSIQSKVMLCDEGWPGWGAEGMKNPWRIKSAFGGGILLDWGTHLIDQVLVLTGKDPLTVYGFMQKGVWSGEVEDYFYAALKFDNELLCQIEVSNNSVITLPRWYIIGTNGTLEVKGNSVPVWDEIAIKYKNSFGIQEYHNIKLQGISEISNGFYDDLALYLKGEKDKFITMYDASKVIKVIDAIRDSSTLNKLVNL